MRAFDGARVGARAAWSRTDLALGRLGADAAGGMLSAAPSVLLAGAFFLAPELIFFPERLWGLVPVALVAALTGFTLRAFWASGALPVLRAEIAGEPRAQALAHAGEAFPRVLGASALAAALNFTAGAASIGAVAAAGIAFSRRPSPWAALALGIGLAAWIAAAFAVDLLGRFAVARAGAAGEGPVRAVAGAASFLGRRAGTAAGVYALFIGAELAAGIAFGTLSSVLVAAGGDAALNVVSIAPRLGAAAVALLVGAFIETARSAAFAALAADDAGMLAAVEAVAAPPEPVVESVLVLDSFPVPKPEGSA